MHATIHRVFSFAGLGHRGQREHGDATCEGGVVLGGALSQTAVFRHLREVYSGYIRGVHGVYWGYRRGAVSRLGWCIKQNRHFQTSWGVYLGYTRGIVGVS